MLLICAVVIGAMILISFMATMVYKTATNIMSDYYDYKRRHEMIIIMAKEMSKMCTTKEIKDFLSKAVGIDLNSEEDKDAR